MGRRPDCQGGFPNSAWSMATSRMPVEPHDGMSRAVAWPCFKVKAAVTDAADDHGRGDAKKDA